MSKYKSQQIVDILLQKENRENTSLTQEKSDPLGFKLEFMEKSHTNCKKLPQKSLRRALSELRDIGISDIEIEKCAYHVICFGVEHYPLNHLFMEALNRNEEDTGKHLYASIIIDHHLGYEISGTESEKSISDFKYPEKFIKEFEKYLLFNVRDGKLLNLNRLKDPHVYRSKTVFDPHGPSAKVVSTLINS